MLAAAVRPVLVSPWQASRSHSSKPVLQHFRRRLRSAKRFPWHVSAKQQDTDEAGNTKADTGSNVNSSNQVLQRFRRMVRSAKHGLPKQFPWLVSAEQQDTDEAGNTKADRGSNVKPAVVDAFKNGSLGFGFSAGGLLYPYYVGVVQQLHEMGVITRDTKLAGASAGSLIAACYHSGIPWDEIISANLELAADCRKNGTRGRLKMVLTKYLMDMLPDDIHERCTGKCYVSITRGPLLPKNMVISEYHSKDDLVSALLASCHIPWWFDSTLLTSFRGKPAFDGGLSNFIPLPPTQHAVRVCCFPASQITAVYDIGISPDNFEDWPHTLKEMLSWAFEPASDELLLEFIGKGRADAKAWAAATAVVDVLEPGASKEASAQSEQQGENYEELKRARPPVHEEDSAAAGLVQGKAATTPAN